MRPDVSHKAVCEGFGVFGAGLAALWQPHAAQPHRVAAAICTVADGDWDEQRGIRRGDMCILS